MPFTTEMYNPRKVTKSVGRLEEKLEKLIDSWGRELEKEFEHEGHRGLNISTLHNCAEYSSTRHIPHASDIENDFAKIGFRNCRALGYIFPFRKMIFWDRYQSEIDYLEGMNLVFEKRGYTIHYDNSEIEGNYHGLFLDKILCNVFYREEHLAKR